MTLRQFINVFNFDGSQKVEIFTFSAITGKENYIDTYFSEQQIENDLFIVLYDVVEIRPIGEFTLQIVITEI